MYWRHCWMSSWCLLQKYPRKLFLCLQQWIHMGWVFLHRYVSVVRAYIQCWDVSATTEIVTPTVITQMEVYIAWTNCSLYTECPLFLKIKLFIPYGCFTLKAMSMYQSSLAHKVPDDVWPNNVWPDNVWPDNVWQVCRSIYVQEWY